ncbi:MAG: hypothetical protein WBA61_11300 [Aequorivita sp.]
MKLFYILSILCFSICGCNFGGKSEIAQQNQKLNGIDCTNDGCAGKYEGPEFINGEDIAHQFSNEMSRIVGNKLKELYTAGNYSKVDLENIKMTTTGMGTGYVVYELEIPFVSVQQKCEAYTSFDHVGGWNHSPQLVKRMEELKKLLRKGEELNISKRHKTPEGLQEYWIQWKHALVQAECE